MTVVRWMKVGPACAHLGGISAKTLYAAVRRGDCQAAHIGAGRNLLFCESWLDQYAERCAAAGGRASTTEQTSVVTMPARRVTA